MPGSISSILTFVQTKFNETYFAATPQIPSVPFYFGPEWIGQQSGPAQIIAFPGHETGFGPDQHFNLPNQPRSLRIMWTQILWMIWSPWPPLPFWVANSAYATGSLTIPTVVSQAGYYFTATVGGTSGATQPSWPGTIGDTVTDGTVTWTCTGTVMGYTASKTDNVEYIRAALVQAIHFAGVGSYKIDGGDWYTQSDQVAMAGVSYVLSTRWKIPLIDAAEGTATLTSLPITSTLENS